VVFLSRQSRHFALPVTSATETSQIVAISTAMILDYMTLSKRLLKSSDFSGSLILAKISYTPESRGFSFDLASDEVPNCLLGLRSQRRSEKVLSSIAPHARAGAKPSYIHRGPSSVHVLRAKDTR
jgi:hypothetical protein